MQPLSVSQLNEQIKSLLESSFVRVYVSGELSRITYHNSGHIYFSIKDERSTLRCVMFRSNAAKLRFRFEEGMAIILDATLSVYVPRGEYQLNVYMAEPSGVGALALAYEQLKQKLQSKGYFESENKKPLPRYPKRVALITSATSAALQDMLRIATHRYTLATLHVVDVLVQGEMAAAQIASAIERCDKESYDIIVIARGGGSIEDLWAFNEEVVADAIYVASTPIVSAIGHEIDWVISDFVADARGATPSAALEMILPDSKELMQTLDAMAENMAYYMHNIVQVKTQQLSHLQQQFRLHSFENRLKLQNDRCEQIRLQLQQEISRILALKEQELNNMQERLIENHPHKRVKKGYVQLAKANKILSLEEVKLGDEIELMDGKFHVTSKVVEKRAL